MKKTKLSDSIQKLKDQLALARSNGNSREIKAIEKTIKRLERQGKDK